MPRGPRLDAPGILHQVTVRGLERRALFRDDRDRPDVLGRLARLVAAGAVTVYACGCSCRTTPASWSEPARAVSPGPCARSWPARPAPSPAAIASWAICSRTGTSPSSSRRSRTLAARKSR